MNLDYHYIILFFMLGFFHFLIFRYWAVIGKTGRGGNGIWQPQEMFTMGMMYCCFIYILIHISLMLVPDPAFLGILVAGSGGATYLSIKGNESRRKKNEESEAI